MTHGPICYCVSKKQKPCSSCIVELYKHLGIFKNTREVRENKFPSAYITQQRTLRVFYFFKINANFI